MIREGKGKEKEKGKEKGKRREREENRKTRGLTGLTVNSCFSTSPLRTLLYLNIYTYFYICVGGRVCIFGVLTVNLLTLPD